MSTLMKIQRETKLLNSTMSPLTLSTNVLDSSFNSNSAGSRNGLLLETTKLKPSESLSSSLSKLATTYSNTNDSSNKLKIRFLMFAEDSDGIRFNMFDSAKTSLKHPNHSASRASNGNSTSNSPISSKLNNEMLTRMVFGSFPMIVSNRTAIKVHSLKNSNKTMISNVFVYYNTNSSKSNKIHKYSCSCRHLKTASQIRRDSLNQIKIHLENNNIHNTKPIDIIKLNNDSQMKTNGLKLTKLDDVTATNDYEQLSSSLNKSKEISINKAETPHQSLSSSDVDSNNLSINQELLNQQSQNSPCSSVPTNYGSYSGIYKRLMRSVSNSLISTATTTTTAIQSSNDFNVVTNGINHDSINELDNLNEFEKIRIKRKTSISVASNSSFSNNNNSKENMEDLCEKCIDSQRYPKFKIGIAVIFCLPSQTPLKSPSSAPSSPQSTSNSPNTQHSLNKQKLNKQSFDPLILFPSLPSLPSSPTTSNENKFNFYTINSNNQIQPQSQVNISNNNENFYEFFFSHLPIIEYQIKELKEKIIQNLPLYFNPVNNHGSSTRSSFSSTSQTNMLHDTNNSSSLQSSSSCFNKQLFNSSRTQFNQKMMIDFEEYEKNFYSLYLSPRINQPAWLTLINNRKLMSIQSNEINETNEKITKTKTSLLGNQLKNINSNTASVCNNLINDFVYINKIINPKLNSQTQQSRRFLNNFRSAFNLSSSQSSLNDKSPSGTSTPTLNGSFLSILLSTILKHHLSWVFTVLPSNEPGLVNQNANLLRKQKANWTTILEKTNPYNPLWAQLGDLHGAVNQPLKLVRTVIVGKNKELIERLLVLLSYFIRCSNSSYFDISAENFDFDKLPSQSSSGQASSSSSASSASSPNLNDHKTFKSPSKSCKHPPSHYSLNENESEELNESDSFIIDNSKNTSNCLHLETSNATISREVNVFELSIDPMSQLNAVLANATIGNNQLFENKQKTNKKYSKRSNDEFCMMSLSSSSSIASPSSCSMSSSPLNIHSMKTNKLNSTNISLNNNSILAGNNRTQSNNQETSHNRKQRNLSSNSFGENCNAQELPLIGCKLKPNYLKSTRMQDNFGYSLLASYCDEFVFEFVLHGTSDKSFLNDLNERLVFSKQNSIIDCPIQESVYIVVDVDEFDVKVYSSESPWPPVKERSIPLIDSFVQSVLDMIKLFQNSEFVLLHLEDKLQELYTKAITLNQLKSQSSQIDDTSLINLMELNDSADLDFLNRILTAVFLPKFEII